MNAVFIPAPSVVTTPVMLPTLHIFCRVVNNFGDIGVCWRLARQMTEFYRVTLWVDDLLSFKQICADIQPLQEMQSCMSVLIGRWPEEATAAVVASGGGGGFVVAAVVIEAFACALPAWYESAMAKCDKPPVWINLDYLSAEAWVEGCHELASLHPSLGLKKYFFFPGFTDRTGGLLIEPELVHQREQFQLDTAAIVDFFNGIGVPFGAEGLSVAELMASCKVSLFCYPDAPVRPLLAAWSASADPVICFVPQGVATEAIEAHAGFVSDNNVEIRVFRTGALTLIVIPFMSQDQYDRLLWACDVNFVRGEDSFVRAQLAGKTMVWQIYPQEQDAHLDKLQAFMRQYEVGMPEHLLASYRNFWLAWNGQGEPDWFLLNENLSLLHYFAQGWSHQLFKKNSLAQSLCQFIQKIS